MNSSLVLWALVPTYPFKFVLSHRSSYITCRAKCWMKMWSHCSNIINDSWQWQENIKSSIGPFWDSGTSWRGSISMMLALVSHYSLFYSLNCRYAIPDCFLFTPGCFCLKPLYLVGSLLTYSLKDMWGNIKCTNISMTAVPEGEKSDKGAEITFEKIIT